MPPQEAADTQDLLGRAAEALRSAGSVLDDRIVPSGFEQLAPEDVEQLIDATLHRLSELLNHERPNGRIAELALIALRLSEVMRWLDCERSNRPRR
jgi:hypothetical protein